jgi:hypothetical protein
VKQQKKSRSDKVGDLKEPKAGDQNCYFEVRKRHLAKIVLLMLLSVDKYYFKTYKYFSYSTKISILLS